MSTIQRIEAIWFITAISLGLLTFLALVVGGEASLSRIYFTWAAISWASLGIAYYFARLVVAIYRSL